MGINQFFDSEQESLDPCFPITIMNWIGLVHISIVRLAFHNSRNTQPICCRLVFLHLYDATLCHCSRFRLMPTGRARGKHASIPTTSPSSSPLVCFDFRLTVDFGNRSQVKRYNSNHDAYKSIGS